METSKSNDALQETRTKYIAKGIVQQHPAGGMEAHFIQQLGILCARFRKMALQAAFARIAQLCSEVDVQIAFLNIGLQYLFE